MSVDEWAQQRAAVKAALDERGMAQSDLAVAVGITQKHLSQILTGRADGGVQLWSEVAAALGCVWTLSYAPALMAAGKPTEPEENKR